MQQEYDIPDVSRRNTLEKLRNNLKSAFDRLPDDMDAEDDEINNSLAEAAEAIEDARQRVDEQLSEIPEFDRGLVQKLVTDHVGRDDTTVRAVDRDVVYDFEVGPYGDETDLRWEVAVAGDGQWFFVEQDGEWVEVWSN